MPAAAMSSRRSSTHAAALTGLVARLPWWLGVLLALISYLVLHRWAATPVAIPLQPGQRGLAIAQAMLQSVAVFAQYVVPLLCLAGAALSAWQRKARLELVDDVARARSASVLDGITWQQFEQLVGEAYRQQGYRVQETGGGGPDGGVDLVLTRGGETVLVQCKQWRALRVGVDVVRQLYGVMAARGAAGGRVVTSGRYTADALAFARGRNIELIDGAGLQTLLRKARAVAPAPVSAQKAASRTTPPAAPAVSAPTAQSPPSCPMCARAMVRRTAKRGAQAGHGFWGCSGYPACRGTRVG